MQKIHLITAGRHAPNQGAPIAFSAEDLRSIAEGYSAELHEAPIVVGHPAADAPAYGWISGLEARDDGLWGEPHQVDPTFSEMVQKGRFKKISIALYRPEHPNNPKPGTWYLRHVGFLGAKPPAVKGLKPVEFGDGDADIVTVEFGEGWSIGWLLSDVAGLFRGVRDYLVGAAGAEQAEKLLPGGRIQRIAEEAVRLQERATTEAARDTAPAFAEGAPSNPEEPSLTEQEVARQREDLAERERAIAAREAEFAERDAAARRAEDTAFVDGLVAQARLPQALAPRAAAVLGALTAETEVCFAEGGADVKQDARAAFRELLAALPPAVEFGEKAPPADVPLDDPRAIATAATEFQEKEAAAGRSVSFAEAVQSVTSNRRASA